MQAILAWQIIVPVLVLVATVLGLIALASRYGLWDPDLMKDTIVWAVGIVIVATFRTVTSRNKEVALRGFLLDSVQLILIIEFVLDAYTLALWLEILLVFFGSVLVCLLAVAESRREFSRLVPIFRAMLSILGLAMLAYAIRQFQLHVADLSNIEAWRELVVFPILSFLMLPVLYALALSVEYQEVLIRLPFFVPESERRRSVRRAIFRTCNVRLARIARLRGAFWTRLQETESEAEAKSVVRDFAGMREDE